MTKMHNKIAKENTKIKPYSKLIQIILIYNKTNNNEKCINLRLHSLILEAIKPETFGLLRYHWALTTSLHQKPLKQTPQSQRLLGERLGTKGLSMQVHDKLYHGAPQQASAESSMMGLSP